MENNPSAAFLTFDWSFGVDPIEPNGCAYYRCKLPMDQLNQAGWEVGMGMPGWNDVHGFGLLIPDNQAIHGWDVIVFKLIMLESIAEKMELAKSMGQKIAVDIDDWFEGLQETNLAHKMTDPEMNPRNNRDHYMYIIDHADAIITSTPFLYNFYKNVKGFDNVYMVRNGIDYQRWQPRRDHSRWLPKVGWVGATPWRSLDLETMAPWFGEFMERNRLDFHHSGNIINAPSAAKQLGLSPKTKTTFESMQPISKYPQLFRKIDIGIVPLNNVEFNHAKSTIKGLEYAAAGVPFIASYSPEYEILAEKGIGRVAYTVDDWLSHLEELLDPAARKEDVERNLEGIKMYESMECRRQDWNDVLHQIREQ